MAEKTTGIPSTAYTRDYYINCCQGYEEFELSQGMYLPLRLSIPLELGRIRPGQTVLDVGCGRGELLLQAARHGAEAWGLDYAAEAITVAEETLANPNHAEIRDRIRLLRASVLSLPFGDDRVDLVFMLDVVEHLYPAELAQSLAEIRRVLKPGGRLIIHTMPNLWYYHLGYPLYRRLQRLRGETLPADPRARWAYSEVHVNEQTPLSMYRVLKAAGYRTRVWLQTTQSYTYEHNLLVRLGMNILTRAYPLRPIFCNDIFAIGVKA